MVITASDKGFEPHLKRLLETVDAKVYDLGGLGYGTPFETPHSDLTRGTFIRCSFKPKIILDALQEDDKIIYLDADTVVKKELNIDWDFDIGATKRRGWEITRYKNNPNVGKYNTGVLFFKKSDATIKFIKDWIKLTEEVKIEQQAFNTLIGDFKGKLKEFTTDEYNWYYFGQDDSKAKIIHYKGNHK